MNSRDTDRFRKIAQKKRENRAIEKRFKELRFPNCIGLFPDACQGVTKDKPGKECKNCPYFRKW